MYPNNIYIYIYIFGIDLELQPDMIEMGFSREMCVCVVALTILYRTSRGVASEEPWGFILDLASRSAGHQPPCCVQQWGKTMENICVEVQSSVPNFEASGFGATRIMTWS